MSYSSAVLLTTLASVFYITDNVLQDPPNEFDRAWKESNEKRSFLSELKYSRAKRNASSEGEKNKAADGCCNLNFELLKEERKIIRSCLKYKKHARLLESCDKAIAEASCEMECFGQIIGLLSADGNVNETTFRTEMVKRYADESAKEVARNNSRRCVSYAITQTEKHGPVQYGSLKCNPEFRLALDCIFLSVAMLCPEETERKRCFNEKWSVTSWVASARRNGRKWIDG